MAAILSRSQCVNLYQNNSTRKMLEPPTTSSAYATTRLTHCSDIIMGAIASQITSLAIVFSTVYSGAYQRKHQSSASLAFVRGIHRSPAKSPHKWPATQNSFHLMTSSWCNAYRKLRCAVFWRVWLSCPIKPRKLSIPRSKPMRGDVTYVTSSRIDSSHKFHYASDKCPTHNAPFWNRNVYTCAHFCHKMVHCGISNCSFVGFVRQAYWLRPCSAISEEFPPVMWAHSALQVTQNPIHIRHPQSIVVSTNHARVDTSQYKALCHT